MIWDVAFGTFLGLCAFTVFVWAMDKVDRSIEQMLGPIRELYERARHDVEDEECL